MKKQILLLGEYDPTFVPHLATSAALQHSCPLLDGEIESVWISTEDINETLLAQAAALWISPGSPYKNLAKTLWAIRTAREQQFPCFGTCGGFQHMILEYARNVLGFQDAQHAEYDPDASMLFLTKPACSLAGREMHLTFAPDSQVARIYGAATATEQYYCQFGVNPHYVPLLKNGPLRISGSDNEGEIRVVELPGHPFFIGTLFVPQTRSTPAQPHPLVTAFVQAALATQT